MMQVFIGGCSSLNYEDLIGYSVPDPDLVDP
jgi:hypothetical protein